MTTIHTLLLLGLLFTSTVFAFTSSTCNAKLYGQIKEYDCFELYKQLPAEPAQDVEENHAFVEPKFLNPRFTLVINPYNNEMIQLPKIWRYRTINQDVLPHNDTEH